MRLLSSFSVHRNKCWDHMWLLFKIITLHLDHWLQMSTVTRWAPISHWNLPQGRFTKYFSIISHHKKKKQQQNPDQQYSRAAEESILFQSVCQTELNIMELWHIMEVQSWPGILDRAGGFSYSIYSWWSAEGVEGDASQSSALVVSLCHWRQQENNYGKYEREWCVLLWMYLFKMLYALRLSDMIWIYHVKLSEAVMSEVNAD